MAIATTKTKLPLDRFAQVAGISPLHFSQVVVADLAPATTCADPILQYSWQDADRTGREELAQAIADAEALLEDRLNFALRPTFYNAYPIQYGRPSMPDVFATSLYDIRGLVRAVPLGVGYAISGGVETKTLLGASVPVVYTDVDGDGYFEKATMTVTGVPTGVQASEIALYYPGVSGNDQFEIRPIAVSLDTATGIATVSCRREQLVLPELLFGLNVMGVDGLDVTMFQGNMDVYRHWLDPSQQQVEFRWDQMPWLPGSSLGAAQYSVQTGAMLVRDARLGWAELSPAHWDAASGTYQADCLTTGRMPDNVRAWFQAGYPLDGMNMASIWERCVTYLALASLWRPLCSCETLETFTKYWAFDWAQNGTDHSQQIARKRLENPLGTTRAAVYAWEQILRYRLPD